VTELESRIRIVEFLKKTGLVILAIVTGLLVGEIGSHFLISVPNTSGWRSDVSLSHRQARRELNQLGFRGQRIDYPDSATVVVLVGDSQVEAKATAFSAIPERRLEHHLRSLELPRPLHVFSLGAAGYGQDQQLLVLREYLAEYRADVVVLWRTPTNDIWNNVFPTHWPANGMPKPTYWLEDGELRGPNEDMGERLDVSSVRLLFFWRSLTARISGTTIWAHLGRDQEWEGQLPPAYQPLTEFAAPASDLWQRMWDAGAFKDENLATEKSQYAIFLTPRSRRMQYGLDLTRELSSEIQNLTVSHGGRFVVFDVAPPSEDEPGETVYLLNGRYYKTSLQQFSDNMDYVKRGLESLQITLTVKDWNVNPGDGHLSDKAVDEAMEMLAEALVPHIASFTVGAERPR